MEYHTGYHAPPPPPNRLQFAQIFKANIPFETRLINRSSGYQVAQRLRSIKRRVLLD